MILYTRIGLSHRIYGCRKSATDFGPCPPGPASVSRRLSLTSHPAKLICKFRHMCAAGTASRVIGLRGFILGEQPCGTRHVPSSDPCPPGTRTRTRFPQSTGNVPACPPIAVILCDLIIYNDGPLYNIIMIHYRSEFWHDGAIYRRRWYCCCCCCCHNSDPHNILLLRAMIYYAALILYIMHVVLRRMSDDDDDEYRMILWGFVIIIVYGEINSPD